jgi:hypothetical protein
MNVKKVSIVFASPAFSQHYLMNSHKEEISNSQHKISHTCTHISKNIKKSRSMDPVSIL